MPLIANANVVLGGSIDGCKAGASIWRAFGGSESVKCIVPSDRVADLSLELGFSGVVNAKGMDAQSLLNALARIENA